MPFHWNGRGFPVPVLAQVGPRTFELCNEFEFETPTRERFPVPKGPERIYDLTSVPDSLTWLIPRYGRHTVAVLLHDDYIEDDTPFEKAEEYDNMFLQALSESYVPMIRRWLLWAGVSAANLALRARAWLRVRAIAWALAVIFVIGVFWWNRIAQITSARSVEWGPFGVWWAELLLIPAFAVLLGRRRLRVGLVAGPAALFALIPTAAVWLGQRAYGFFENRMVKGFDAEHVWKPNKYRRWEKTGTLVTCAEAMGGGDPQLQ